MDYYESTVLKAPNESRSLLTVEIRIGVLGRSCDEAG
jgi:hypothetical protein